LGFVVFDDDVFIAVLLICLQRDWSADYAQNHLRFFVHYTISILCGYINGIGGTSMESKFTEEDKDRVRYIHWIVIGFARGFKRAIPEAYQYLREFGGIDFLYENYNYEHTQSEIHTHMALLDVCRNNGGWL